MIYLNNIVNNYVKPVSRYYNYIVNNYVKPVSRFMLTSFVNNYVKLVIT